MSHNGCWEETELLLKYAAGGLDAADREAVERHMEACGPCREFVAGQRAVWAALDRWETPPVAEDFDRRSVCPYRAREFLVGSDYAVIQFRPDFGGGCRGGRGGVGPGGRPRHKSPQAGRACAAGRRPTGRATAGPTRWTRPFKTWEMVREFSGLVRPDAPM